MSVAPWTQTSTIKIPFLSMKGTPKIGIDNTPPVIREAILDSYTHKSFWK